MVDGSRHFDSFLPQIGADHLKRMVRVYGGKSTMRKQECIDFLLAALADPATVRQAVAALEPFEQFGLALTKQMGGATDHRVVGIGILASGAMIPPSLARRSLIDGIVSHLLGRGLLLSNSYDPSHLDSSWASDRTSVFSDPRLLAHVGPPKITPVALRAAAPPGATLLRKPPTVILDIIGFLQTLENMGGLGLTRQGELRVNDVRRFQKALNWPDGDLEVDGLLFKDALNGLIQALRHSDFFTADGTTLVLKNSVAEVAAQEYAEQVSTLVNGFVRASQWHESATTRWMGYGNYHRQARVALLIALASLPFDSDDFYSLDEFDRAQFERIGEHFSVAGEVHKYLSTYMKTPAEVRQMEADWRADRREKWLKQDRIWIEAALTSWLYYLGMVELGMAGMHVVAFRLTELGKAVLHPAEDFAVHRPATVAPGGAAGTWIVQPNFDLIVYLDRTSPAQLAFLEKHAERTQSQQYVAHYRLTRESIYRGMEGGTTLAELLEMLAQHAQTPLPQNVIVEISEWAALREQVILHHRAHLLEFANTDERQAALDAGAQGKVVGDRFLMLAATVDERTQLPQISGAIERIDYAKPLPQILRVTEMGRITLHAEALDLLIEAQLDRWAERMQDGGWQLTAASVSAQIKAGARIDDLIDLLRKRLAAALPALLELALRNWAGRAKAVELETLALLRCRRSDVMDAIRQSEALRSHLRGVLDDDVLIFDSERLEELQEILSWAGLTISGFSP